MLVTSTVTGMGDADCMRVMAGDTHDSRVVDKNTAGTNTSSPNTHCSAGLSTKLAPTTVTTLPPSSLPMRGLTDSTTASAS